MVRIATIDVELCKPKKCNLECIRFCPINRTGTKAIEIREDSKKPTIYEEICIGCGICVKKCPFNAITIVNLPEELETDLVHRYGINAFKLYRLPIPKQGMITGIIGKNATGKTTALKILSGKLKPNLGCIEKPPEWDEIIKAFKGTELQMYFKKLVDGKIRTILKIQYVDAVPRYLKGEVGKLLTRVDERNIVQDLKTELGLEKIWSRELKVLSGGELQKFLIAAALSKDADVYMFDEPCSYLDVYERMRIAKIIRRYTVQKGKTAIVVEHDIAILDYLSDLVHVIYGVPGAYGIVSHPYGVKSGINFFLDGFLPDENMRIRSEPIRFHVKPPTIAWLPELELVKWTDMLIKLGNFKLKVREGSIHKGEVIGILGPNGIGKTTFVRVLAGEVKPVEGVIYSYSEMTISYKPQYVSTHYAKFSNYKVIELLHTMSPSGIPEWFKKEIIVKLGVDRIYERLIGELSGGELQKVAIVSCLLKEAKLYLLDEPSAYLDVEERLAVAKAIKNVVEMREAAAFVVEHDIMLQDYLAHSLMVFRGTPGIEGNAEAPANLRRGINTFLKDVGVTFRRDARTKRPRVNKEGSYLDRLQKSIGEYYYVET